MSKELALICFALLGGKFCNKGVVFSDPPPPPPSMVEDHTLIIFFGPFPYTYKPSKLLRVFPQLSCIILLCY